MTFNQPKITTLLFTSLIAFTMTACSGQQKPTQEQLDDLIARTKANLVFVEGGTFTMGDFGPITREDKLPLLSSLDNKFLHEVTLDSFSMAALRTTYADYALYTASMELPPVEEVYKDYSILLGLRQIPNMPVGVSWDEAHGYCQWLGGITGLPMTLPTEAQWEYAARNRGQFVIFPTDNGEYEEGRNVPSYEQIRSYISSSPTFLPPVMYPVGLFPPNPLGLHDMGSGGSEWVLDWYDANYYKNSPEHNPQGPETGSYKARRGSSDGNMLSMVTVERLYDTNLAHPIPNTTTYSYWDNVIRCAVNLPTPIEP